MAAELGTYQAHSRQKQQSARMFVISKSCISRKCQCTYWVIEMTILAKIDQCDHMPHLFDSRGQVAASRIVPPCLLPTSVHLKERFRTQTKLSDNSASYTIFATISYIYKCRATENSSDGEVITRETAFCALARWQWYRHWSDAV